MGPHFSKSLPQTVVGSKSTNQRPGDIATLMRQTSKGDLREHPVAIFTGWEQIDVNPYGCGRQWFSPFRSQHLHKKPCVTTVICNPNTGETEIERFLKLSSRFNKRLSQKPRNWRVTEEASRLRSLASTGTYIHMRTNTHMQEHMKTLTHKDNSRVTSHKFNWYKTLKQRPYKVHVFCSLAG